MANTSKVESARKRFSDSTESGESSVIKRKACRSSANGITVTNEEVLTTRSKAITYDKTLCLICQKTGGKLHLVQTKETGKLMLSVSEKLSIQGFFRRLNSISSATNVIVNDVMYHNLCWADTKRKETPKSEQSVNYSGTLADREITTLLRVTKMILLKEY